MTKSVLTALSLSLFTLAAAVPSRAFEQGGSGHVASAATASSRSGCPTQAEIDLGWKRQQQLIEDRLAARSSEGLNVPGAIIVPPFPAFAPYRADAPGASVAGKTAKPSNRSSRSRGLAANKS